MREEFWIFLHVLQIERAHHKIQAQRLAQVAVEIGDDLHYFLQEVVAVLFVKAGFHYLLDQGCKLIDNLRAVVQHLHQQGVGFADHARELHEGLGNLTLNERFQTI